MKRLRYQRKPVMWAHGRNAQLVPRVVRGAWNICIGDHHKAEWDLHVTVNHVLEAGGSIPTGPHHIYSRMCFPREMVVSKHTIGS